MNLSASLSTAVRHNASDTIQANFEYTYDDGDNLVTKVEPWADDFSDGTITGADWTTTGTWSASTKVAKNTAGAAASLFRTVNDDDVELRYTYSIDSYTAATPTVSAHIRHNTSSGERLLVQFQPTKAVLGKYNGTTWTTYDNTGVTTTTGTKYKVRIEADGADVKVWRSPASGGAETLVFDRNDLPEYDGNRFSLIVSADTAASLDDILILADNHERETTFTPANNNELASSTDYNGTTTYAYDNWSRLSTETRGGVTKTYSWTMANLLAGVDSSDANDTDVSYLYTGDLKRLFRFENGNLKNSYGWDAGFNVVDETEWSGGNPVADKAYAGRLAEVDTTSTPSYAYLTHDHLGSTRGLWDGSIDQTGDWEYTPYGAPFAFAGPADVTQLYTGHDLDRVTGQYFAPFRFLNPNAGRWLSRDPLGMVDGTNIYSYVGGNPINYLDPLALCMNWLDGLQMGLDGIGFIPGLEFADGLNALISLGRGNYGDAALSAAAMIPFVGNAATGAKLLKNGRKQIWRGFPTQKAAKDAAANSPTGLWQRKSRNGKPRTQGPERHDGGPSHYHDNNHDNKKKPNTHYWWPS